jgi:hypothetical protein
MEEGEFSITVGVFLVFCGFKISSSVRSFDGKPGVAIKTSNKLKQLKAG